MPQHRWWMPAVAVLLGSLGMTSPAGADPVGCERGIARASGRYIQGRAKAIFKCEDAKTKARVRDTTVCATDPLYDAQRLNAATKLFADINLTCGGPNRDCGDGDDEPLGPTAWGAVSQCPDFNGAGCTNPIATCLDIATCLQCMHDAAVGQSMDLYYGQFDAGEFGTYSTVNRCQQAIGKATTKYLTSRSKALAKCWDGRLTGRHANACPDPGDGRAAVKIAAAETKKRKIICKACGGADGLCNGSGDLAPSAVGFVSSCPPVSPLYPPSSCGGAFADLMGLVDCVDCVTNFDVDCAGTASVPGIVTPLPVACGGGATTTTSSTSPPTTTTSSTSTSTTSTTSTSTITGSSSSTSTSTTSTSTSAPPTSSSSSSTVTTTTGAATTSSTSTTLLFDFLSTAATGDCGNAFRDVAGTIPLKKLLCGGLSLGGGLSQVPDNTTPAGATNRFTLSGCVGTSCNIGPVPAGGLPTGVDCTAVGCKFGVPLPISNAGLSVCVTNTFSPVPPSGTLDIGTGNATWSFQLNSATVLTANPSAPCPTCRVSVGGAICSGTAGSPCTGVCDGGPNNTLACASRNSGGVTSDCPSPSAVSGTQRCYRGTNNEGVCSTSGDCPGGSCAQFIGNIPISLNPLTTGTASLTGQNPVNTACVAPGNPSTCCTGAGTGNCTNAACTALGLPFGCCTGAGTGVCQTFCPNHLISETGAFNSAICRNGPNSGKPCVNTTTVEAADNANCGAGNACRPGNLINYCHGGTADGLGCSTDAACTGGGKCVRAGQMVKFIREVGVPAPGPLVAGVPKAIKLGSVFCVPATTNPTVNSNADLPGPGATSVVGTVTLLP